MIDTLIVIAKEPVAGRVKTRLVPPLTYGEAARVAEAALVDTLALASQFPCRQRMIVLDGRPGPWLPAGWTVVPQVLGGLDGRLTAAFLGASGPTLLIGMDTPQLQLDHLLAADLEAHDACLGPAEDGGYWSIGLRDPATASGVIPGVPMSSAHTGRAQRLRLAAAGLSAQLLDELVDVDDIQAAHRVAALAPVSRFAATLHRITREQVA